MTPYATLLIKPDATDYEVRKRYHHLIRMEHPDLGGAAGTPGTHWYVYKEAYALIDTEYKRKALKARNRFMADVCQVCNGSGVKYSALKPKQLPTLCVKCEGEGYGR